MRFYMTERLSELEESGQISFDRQGSEKFMSYNGALRNVIQTLETAAGKTSPERDFNFFLYATRLLIGVIDYGLKTGRNVLGLKHSVEDFCLYGYKGDYESAFQELGGLELTKPMLDYPLNEEADNISWASFKPRLVKRLARKIICKKRKHYTPEYIILDGHNAYRPGLMLSAAFEDTRVCAIKNVRNEKDERCPKLLKGEEKHLNSDFYKKRLLLFGENISTGEALKALYDFIIRISHPKQVLTSTPLFIPGDKPVIRIDYIGAESSVFC